MVKSTQISKKSKKDDKSSIISIPDSELALHLELIDRFSFSELLYGKFWDENLDLVCVHNLSESEQLSLFDSDVVYEQAPVSRIYQVYDHQYLGDILYEDFSRGVFKPMYHVQNHASSMRVVFTDDEELTYPLSRNIAFFEAWGKKASEKEPSTLDLLCRPTEDKWFNAVFRGDKCHLIYSDFELLRKYAGHIFLLDEELRMN